MIEVMLLIAHRQILFALMSTPKRPKGFQDLLCICQVALMLQAASAKQW